MNDNVKKYASHDKQMSISDKEMAYKNNKLVLTSETNENDGSIYESDIIIENFDHRYNGRYRSVSKSSTDVDYEAYTTVYPYIYY